MRSPPSLGQRLSQHDEQADEAEDVPQRTLLDGTVGQFRVRAEILDAYPAIDLSLESDDGDTTHSSTSLMRGVCRS